MKKRTQIVGTYDVGHNGGNNATDTNRGEVTGQHLVVTASGLDSEGAVMAGCSCDEPGDNTEEKSSDGSTNAAPLVGLAPGNGKGDWDDGGPKEDTHEGL